MNCLCLICLIAIAAAPPPPTPNWSQLTPGVDYEANRIGIGLQIELAHRLITEYFDNGEVLTRTGITELDAIGARYGLVAIKPTFEDHAYEVYGKLKRSQADPYPPFSSSFRFIFAGAIDVPAALADYAAVSTVLWVNHLPFPTLDAQTSEPVQPAATDTPRPPAIISAIAHHEIKPGGIPHIPGTGNPSVAIACGCLVAILTMIAVACAIVAIITVARPERSAKDI